MKQRLLNAIRDEALWEPGMRVAIAVSGGPDSTALAHLLQATVGVHRAELSVVHVDHGWSDASVGWAEHVRAFAERLGLPFHVERVACEPSETAARSARFRVFQALDTDRVALGHHRDDQVETVLLHLLRGTHGRGLRGMLPRRDRYVRPLLGFDRDELRAWCDRNGLATLDDPSNDDPRHLRTRLRRLVGALEQTRAGASDAIAHLAGIQAEENAFLEGLAARVELDRPSLVGAPRVLRRRRLRQWLDPITSGPLDAVLVAVERGRGVVELDSSRSVRVTGDRVELVLNAPAPLG